MVQVLQRQLLPGIGHALTDYSHLSNTEPSANPAVMPFLLPPHDHWVSVPGTNFG